MEIPDQLKDRLAQFQSVQNQLQIILAQKQQLMLASVDAESALSELEKSKEGKVYKMAGTLIIESNRADSKKDLSEAKETAEARIKVLEKQETKLRERFEEMRGEIAGMLEGGRGPKPPKAG
jgi:prefoldin beta subunit